MEAYLRRAKLLPMVFCRNYLSHASFSSPPLESGGGGGGGGDAAEAEEEKEAEEEVEEAPPAVDVSVTGVPLSSCSFLSVVSALPHFQLIVSDVWRR